MVVWKFGNGEMYVHKVIEVKEEPLMGVTQQVGIMLRYGQYLNKMR